MALTVAFRAALCVLLSASLLMPPAVRHAHAGGDGPHDHDDQPIPAGRHKHTHTHPHRHGHDGHAHTHGSGGGHGHDSENPESGGDSAALPQAHLHIALFGFNLTLPCSDSHDGREGDDRDLAVSAVKLIRLVDEDLLQASPGSTLDPTALAGSAAGLEAASVRPQAADLFRPVTSVPLCDSARHARSGVQLI